MAAMRREPLGINSQLATYFGLEQAGTTVRREVLAGVTTFVTMSYIIAINPAILKTAGIPEGPRWSRRS